MLSQPEEVGTRAHDLEWTRLIVSRRLGEAGGRVTRVPITEQQLVGKHGKARGRELYTRLAAAWAKAYRDPRVLSVLGGTHQQTGGADTVVP